jgi:hypothetical protein
VRVEVIIRVNNKDNMNLTAVETVTVEVHPLASETGMARQIARAIKEVMRAHMAGIVKRPKAS